MLKSSCQKIFKNLNQPQTQPLDSLKPCNIRKVFLENSWRASEDILAFINYYQNQGTFILDSIPAQPEKYIINNTQATTRQWNSKFMPCSTIFYFQDQLIATTANQKDLPPGLLLFEYFQTFTVYVRNENPPTIVFIAFNAVDTSVYYTYLRYISTNSSFYVFSLDSAKIICLSCGRHILWEVNEVSDSIWRKNHVNYGTKISVLMFTGRRWDTKQVNSFYASGIFPERLVLGGYPEFENCFFRVVKQLLNTTDDSDLEIFYGVGNFFLMDSDNVDLVFPKNQYSRYEALPYGMKIMTYQFGTLTSPDNHDISSLTKRFDMATWSFLISSFFLPIFVFPSSFSANQEAFHVGNTHFKHCA